MTQLDIKDEYINYLKDQSWDHVVDGTIRTAYNSDSISVLTRKFVRRLEQRAQHKVNAFAVYENVDGAHHHVHLLTQGTSNLDVDALKKTWSWGRATSKRYDPFRDGIAYNCKYLNSDKAEFEIFGRICRAE